MIRSLIIVLGLLVIGVNVVQAQFMALDPRLEWKVLETEHFRIIYHEGLEEFAIEAAEYSEAAFDYWAEELDYELPFKVNKIVADIGDMAAGAANPLFAVTIQGTSTSRATNEWLNAKGRNGLEQVIFHELGHVVDLAKVEGVPELLRSVFGTIVLPNITRPLGFVEGIPIVSEMKRGGASRANDPREGMYLRAMLLNDEFTPFDHLIHTGYSRDEFPSPYMLNHNYGAWMTRYMVDAYGDDVLKKMDDISSSQILPLLTGYLANDFGGVIKQTTGDTPQQFYQGFQAWLSELFRPQIEAARSDGVTQSIKISQLPFWNNEPAISPDGQWVAYYHYDMDRNGSVRMMRIDGSEEQILFSVPLELPFFRPPYWAASPTWSPDGTKLAYHKHSIQDQFYLLGDIYVYDLLTETETRLTQGARAFKPTWLPDGSVLVYGHQNNHGLTTDLMMYHIGQEQSITLHEFPYGQLLDDFAISPDGEKVAISLWEGGFQDIYILDSQGMMRLTQDAATDTDPVWSPDGEFVLFSSDHNDVNNLYAINVSNGNAHKVTTMLTGAFAPDVSPNGDQIVFVGYNVDGYEIHTMDYAPASWTSVSLSNEALPEPANFPEVEYEMTDYSPFELMAPPFWLPIPGLEGQLGLFTVGTDPMGYHTYQIIGGINMESSNPFYDLTYVNAQFYPTVTLNAIGDDDGDTQSLTVDVPMFVALDQSQNLSVGLVRSNMLDDLLQYDASAAWSGQISYAHDLYSYTSSFSVSGVLTFLEGNTDPRRRYEVDLRQTMRLPFEQDHGIALKLTAGWTDGTLFGLGGSNGTYLLRGLEPQHQEGSIAIAGSVEYRFPILSIERSLLGMWPLFLDDIDGSVFVDAGIASSSLTFSDVQLGIGAEVHTGFVLGYGIGNITLTLGGAYALGQDSPQLIIRGGTAF